MKAYEQRELKKLQHFSVENGKMLKKFERISQGKELSVGHHKVRQETSSSKAKTLNISRNQQVAEEIDYENSKISNAIMTAKISV